MARTQSRLLLSTILPYGLLLTPSALVWMNTDLGASISLKLGTWGFYVLQLLQTAITLPILFAALMRQLGSETRDQFLWESPVWRNVTFILVILSLDVIDLLVDLATAGLDAGPVHDRINSEGLALAGHWILVGCWTYFSIRLWFIVPASAIHGRQLDLPKTFKDTEGRFWELYLTWLVASSPAWLANWLVIVLDAWRRYDSASIERLYGAILGLGTLPLAIVGASVFATYYKHYCMPPDNR
jgi:hypothetical protein